MGSIGRNSTFSEYGHAAYEIKENQERNSMVANILSADTPDPGDGVSRSKCTSEYGHGAYQIKEYHDCSNMVANILLADPPTHRHNPRDRVNRSNFNFFRRLSCCISN